MKSNLDYGTSAASASPQTDNCLNEKYCYNDDNANCSTFGGLYQWDELMQYQFTPGSKGLCMPGWHVPTNAEWLELFNFYQNQGTAGKPLQEPVTLGFNAKLSGILYNNIYWDFKDFATLYWTSTLSTPTRALTHGLNTINYSVSDYTSARSNALPVRCVKD